MPGVLPLQPFPVWHDPNQQAVHSNATIVASGSQVFNGYGATEVTLFVNVKASPTGTLPTIQYTIQEVDPGDGTTVIGTTASSTGISAIGIQKVTLPFTYGGSIKVSWVVTGTLSSFTQVYATLVAKTATMAVLQSVAASLGNSSTTPLAALAIFTGLAESTLGVAGIQVNIFSDVGSYQKLTPDLRSGLQVQQSMDGVNWDIIDDFSVKGGVGFSTTVQATASYYRVIYQNGNTAQSVFRLQTNLCPIVEVVPRSLGPKAEDQSLSVVFSEGILPLPVRPVLGPDGEVIANTNYLFPEMLLELRQIRKLLETLTDESFQDEYQEEK